MLKSPVTRILAILALTAGPVFAGAVYVPLLPSTVGDVAFTPQVVIGNAASAKRTYSSFFIGEDQNGVTRPGDPVLIEIPGGDTVTAAITNNVGLLEINGAADILVYGTMPGANGQAQVVNMPLPMITSSNAADADDFLHIVGLVRNSTLISTMTIVNLGKVAATCSVKVLDNKGATLVNASTLTFKPLSMRHFPDALSGVTGNVDGARAEVTCNQQFYAFGNIHSLAGAVEPIAATVLPSATGASSLTIPGGNNGTGNCANSTATHCYFLEGLVFQPQKGVANQKRVKFDVSQGSYKRVHFSMDVFFSGLNSRNPGGLHQFFWMAIDSKNPDLVGFTSLRDNNKAVMLRTGIGVNATGKSKIVKAASLVKGETYAMDYIYDTDTDDVVWTITEKGSGRLVVSVFDTPNVNNVNFGGNGHMAVDLSFNGENPAEPPSWGWKYENLFFEIFRR